MFPVGTAFFDGEVFGVCVSELTAPGERYKGPEHSSTWYGVTV